MSNLWVVASAVFLLNLPFGLYRARARRFSRPWFLAVHLPVPLVVGLRVYSGLGWSLASFPVILGAFFLGQYLGGQLRHLQRRTRPASADSSAVASESSVRCQAPPGNPGA